VIGHYKETAEFSGYRVYMRNDLAERIAEDERAHAPIQPQEETHEPSHDDERSDPTP
jgi:hypothetical protein